MSGGYMPRQGRKGQVTPLDLIMIAFVFFIGVGFFMLANFLSAKDMIISKQAIYLSMEVDDSGSELVSLLSSTSGGRSHMEAVGSTWAVNHAGFTGQGIGGLMDAVEKLGPSYELTIFGSSLEAIATVPELGEVERDLLCIRTDHSSPGRVMSWPMPAVREVSSKPGFRTHPIDQVCKCHSGVDIPGGGHEVRAAAAGTVRVAGPVSGYGNAVKLAHEGELEGYESLYGHLELIMSGVSPGAKVAKGQTIGRSGSTGLSTGAHLHFEVKRGGDPVDPCALLEDAPQGCSVKDRCTVERDMEGYMAQVPLPGAREGSLRHEVELVKG